MQKSLYLGLPNLVTVESFSVFPEYFIGISILYVLIVVALITYNVYGLMLQKSVSECISLIMLMAFCLIVNDDVLNYHFLSFYDSIINDYLATVTRSVICFFTGLYFFIIADSLKEQKLVSFEYLLILLFAVLGLLLMCNSNDLLTAYLAIELSSLAFYILASFKKDSSYSIEGGLKYFVTGAVSSALFLLGSSFLYGLSGSISFCDFFDLFSWQIHENIPGDISSFSPLAHDFIFIDYFIDYWIIQDLQPIDHMLIEEGFWAPKPKIISPYAIFYLMAEDGFHYTKNIEYFNDSFIELGLALILFSLFIKLALAPFHLWTLDVYEGSPTSSTIFFAVISKLSIFVLLIRICHVSFFNLYESWQFYSLWIGLLSIFVGSFGGLKQRKLKTLLAYSSVSHMGYSLLAFSTTTLLGIQMLLFYMIVYMISSLAIWYIVLLLRVKKKRSENKYNKELGDLALLRLSNPTLALFLSLVMFSIAGIPPMIGFLAKMNVFLTVVGVSFYFIGLSGILFSVVATFYYIRLIKVLYFENFLVGKLYYSISTKKTVLLSVLILTLIFTFMNPTLLYLLTYKVVLTLS